VIGDFPDPVRGRGARGRCDAHLASSFFVELAFGARPVAG
jgi:hypothetical protein